MSLEEQLRRMGEARAAEAGPADWRQRSARQGRNRRWVGAAAAVVLLVAAIVGSIAVFGGDDGASTEVAGDGVPATTGSTAPPSAPGAAGPCAANPAPGADVLDRAVHLHPDRTPLDLDNDGIEDELVAYVDESDDVDREGGWVLVARLAGGWTAPADIDMSPTTSPRLATTSDGAAAAHDLDGDGGLEFFLTGYPGNLAGLTTYRPDCSLRYYDSGLPIGPIGLPGSCEEVCYTRVTCSAGTLLSELAFDLPPGSAAEVDADWAWIRSEVDIVDGAVVGTELPPRWGVFGAYPADGPGADDTGIFDCRPAMP